MAAKANVGRKIPRTRKNVQRSGPRKKKRGKTSRPKPAPRRKKPVSSEKRGPAKKKRAAPKKRTAKKHAPKKQAPKKKRTAKRSKKLLRRALDRVLNQRRPPKKKRAETVFTRRQVAAEKKRNPPLKVREIYRTQIRDVIPEDWKERPRVLQSHLQSRDIERMAAQLAQRIGEKIVGGGYAANSIEAKILLALMAAEQTGTLNREFYEQAGEYEGYDTPQDVYELWIYAGQ
jgi:hypothetical protein